MIHGYLKYSKLAEQRSESADTKENKKIIDLKTALFNEAGLERNRFISAMCGSLRESDISLIGQRF